MREFPGMAEALAERALIDLRDSVVREGGEGDEPLDLRLEIAIEQALERLLLLAHAAGLDTHDVADDAKRALRSWVLNGPLPRVRYAAAGPLSQNPADPVPREVVQLRERLANVILQTEQGDIAGDDTSKLDEERIDILERLADFAPGGPNHG